MQQSISYFREQFPYLQNRGVYFNHAAISPLSIYARKRIDQNLDMRTTGVIDDYKLFIQVAAKAKVLTGKLIDAEAERIAFVDNTTNGLNILAQGLPLSAGDEIILNNLEFPANVYPFLNLQSRGVVVKYAQAHAGVVSAEDVLALVTEKTRLISISQVQFLTGYRADMQMIGEYCRKHNICFCVDAIQGLGAIPLSVKDCYIDFLSCGTQKWLMGSMGLAFVYVSEVLQEQLHIANAGWLSVEDAWNLLDYQLVPRKTAEAFQPGTINAAGLFGFLGALELFEESTQEYREQRVLDNTEYFMQQLHAAGLPPLLQGVPRKNLSGIVTIAPREPERMFATLEQENITASLRERLIRFSPHYYNTTDEIDRVIAVLKQNP